MSIRPRPVRLTDGGPPRDDYLLFMRIEEELPGEDSMATIEVRPAAQLAGVPAHA